MRALATLLNCLLVLGSAFPALADRKPGAGDRMPELVLPLPAAAQDRAYLGLGAGQDFKLAQVSAQLLLVEIMGVYCPRCHEQAPLFKTLLARLERGDLKDRVKMLGIAVGATMAEVELVRKQWGIRHPVVPDEAFAAHKLLGEPRTPFILLVDRQGRVLYSHEGVIRDMDTFYQTIKKLVP